MKVWAKTLHLEKLTRSYVHEKEGRLTKSFFEACIREVAEKLDIPCPIILKSHIYNYVIFNTAKFSPADFVESVDFDFFVIENVPDPTK